MNSFIDTMKGQIDSLLFDFGGVLLDLHPEKTFEGLEEILGMPVGPDIVPDELLQVFLQYEKGKIRDERLLWNIQHLPSPHKPDARKVIDAWNAMLGGWQKSKLDFLEEIGNHFDVYLLSNTNQMHLDWVYRDLKKHHDIADFDTRFFKNTYYSHLIGMRKPDIEIFEFVIEDSKLDPSRTLFIDDTQVNVDAAKSAGLHAVFHQRNSPLDYLFDLIS